MASIKIRHLVAKPQKGGHTLFYWQPPRALRVAGFLPRRLAERTNALEDAIAEAQKLNAEVDAWRAGTAPAAIKDGTVPWLVKVYRRDARYTDLAESTQRGYDQSIKLIEAWSGRAGHPPVSSIQRRHIRDWYRAMAARTPAQANAVMRVLHLLLAFAMDEGLIAVNPAAKQRLRARPPRQTVWSAGDVAAFCEAARKADRASMALAVMLAVSLGQRQGDVLRLPWSAWDGETMRLRQGKTGARIEVPATDELRAALDAAPRKSPNIIVSETTGRPYKPHNFSHVFAEIRAGAGLGDVWFMDLRRTAIVRLAEAGCEVYEIAAISGHSLHRTMAILEVYLPRNAAMARTAIAKLGEHKTRPKLEVNAPKS